MSGPKMLFFDIETSPIISYTWGLFDQNVALNQVKDDWCVIAFAAKWASDPESKVIYHDQRGIKDIRNDKKLLQKIWKLLDEADIVVSQNGVKFDQKKLFARFLIHGMPPPSSFKHVDTLKMARKHFAFTSNKLEYLSNTLNLKFKKLKHSKFSGFELWRECMSDNLEAWKEMALYNKHDVLALEGLYRKLVPWDGGVDLSIYSNSTEYTCTCGSTETKRNGFFYTGKGKYQRFKCLECGHESRDRNNLLSEEKRASLRVVKRG